MYRLRKYFFLLAIILSFYAAYAQPSKKLIEVIVTPDRNDWQYQLGERADFQVMILKNGQPLKNIEITYEIGHEQMPPVIKSTRNLSREKNLIKGVSMKAPGFVRCHVNVVYEGKTYTGWGTAGFEPERIEATIQLPLDFEQFWEQAKQQLSEVPMDAEMTLMPELCTSKINVYHVSLQNISMPYSWMGKSRFYGMLSVPKKKGSYPAILAVPGAGVRPYGRDDRAAEGVIVFRVGIHGIPVNMEPYVYDALATGALSDYYLSRLDNRDEYYYKRVYLGCVRAVDFICSLEQYDGENLAVTGGSQGGALSIVAAGLDSRIKYLAAFYPALCDLTGYTAGRAGGWPHMFREYDEEKHPEWQNTAMYYDVVNFARTLTVPGWYSWGYNDNVCPPTSMFAAYNLISSQKEFHPFFETGHWTFPEQHQIATNWLFEKLEIGAVK
ncbi:acetylxylan esterase [Limibacter armeniacum]|uniref:acetylxylan esterase n=1 Tax=Limibacter armeniacum TaxID=466084 RepID=UPI002FE5DCE0